MHPFKVKKLQCVNQAMNIIYTDLKAFRKSIQQHNTYAVSTTKEYKLQGIRKIDTCFIWDKIQGFKIRITASFGYYGQAQQTYFYLPIHSDISHLFTLAFNNANENGDAAYARAEKAFTGCSAN